MIRPQKIVNFDLLADSLLKQAGILERPTWQETEGETLANHQKGNEACSLITLNEWILPTVT